MRIYRVLLACALTACSVPDYFLVDGQGSGSGSGSGHVDGGADAVPDAAPGAALITNVTSTSNDGYYKAGDAISIKVTFDASVTVDETGGTPTIALNTGGRGTYVSGTGTNTLTFTYMVVAGEQSSDLDYTGTTALVLNGGTIKNGTVNSRVTLPAPGASGSLGANKALVIDAVTPVVGTVTGPNLYAASNAATFTYAVTETNPGTTTCMLTAGMGVVVSCSTTGAMLSGLNEGPHTVSITHMDAAGNVSAPKTYSWTVDTIAPVVSTVTGPAMYAQSASATLSYSVTETNQGSTTCTQTVGMGTVSSCTTTGATFSSLSEGAHTVTITHTDLAGTTSAVRTYSWTVDTINPSISTPTGPAAYDNNKNASLSWTLTEANPGNTACSWTQGTGAIAGCSNTGVTVSGLSEGAHVLQITHTDLAGRTGTKTYSWTVDTIAPVVSTITVTGLTNGWIATSDATLNYTITDANLNTTMCSHTSGMGTESVCNQTKNAYTQLSIGAHTMTIKHTDLAGNVGSQTITFSSCPPVTYSSPSTFAFQFRTPTDCGQTMDIWAWGGGGAGGNPNTSGGTGGGGGFASGTLNGVGTQMGYSVYVGGGGKNSTGGINGGGDGGVGANERGGGGGGWSGVSIGATYFVVAAGGGGGGGCSSDANGGGAGGPIGFDGTGQSSIGGKGATQTSPGAGGAAGGQMGQGMTGGAGAGPGQLCGAGGGGGGFAGGGGGGSIGPPPAFGTGGGGGGSSRVDPSLTNANIQPASGSAPGGRTLTQYVQGVGVGTPSGNFNYAGDGMVIIHVHP